MKLGLAKFAQEGTETVMPEEKGHETALTCLSDCQYSQNPERVCMLKSISLEMQEDGSFQCGQYSPPQEPSVEQ